MPDLEHRPAFGAGDAIASVRRSLTRVLHAGGMDSADIDARYLLELATGLTGVDIIANPGRPLSKSDVERLTGLLSRRLAGEPVSRLRGSRDFYGRSFVISPAVLDPRPETETIVDFVREIWTATGRPRNAPRVLDIGTGSGCLIVTLLKEFPDAVGVATDISEAALEIAKANAGRHDVLDRVRFEQTNALDGIDDTFELVVSNPPYIPTTDIAGLSPDVRLFDPAPALDGGGDGLDVYRAIARGLPRVLANGWVVVEIGAGQSAAVMGLFAAAIDQKKLKDIRVLNDLSGLQRCVAVRTLS